MKSIVNVRDHRITSLMDLPDGSYSISIERINDEKTMDQTRKLWATCGDISERLYGNKSEKESIYLQVLQMAGQRTFRLTIDEDAIDDFKKQNGVKCVAVLSREVVDHRPMAYIEACMSGIRDMSRQEVSRVIDCCCRYADAVGVVPQLERNT